MREGNIVLVNLPQSDGSFKIRPALVLKILPKYNDLLVCGISTQLHQQIENIDEILNEKDIAFSATGLRNTSLIRLLYIAVITTDSVPGSIGKIPASLQKQLLQRLSDFLLG